MARMNLKLKIPVTDFDFDVDENSLESNGWVRIVRCKDCKHYDNPQKCIVANVAKHKGEDRFLLFDANWFCADGEREVQE